MIELYYDSTYYDSLPDERSLRSTGESTRNATVIPLGLVTNHPRSKYLEGRATRVRKNLGEGKNLSLEVLRSFFFSSSREEDKIVKLVSIEEEKF